MSGIPLILTVLPILTVLLLVLFVVAGIKYDTFVPAHVAPILAAVICFFPFPYAALEGQLYELDHTQTVQFVDVAPYEQGVVTVQNDEGLADIKYDYSKNALGVGSKDEDIDSLTPGSEIELAYYKTTKMGVFYLGAGGYVLIRSDGVVYH